LYLQKFRDSLSVPNRTGVTQNCIYRSFGTASLSQIEQELHRIVFTEVSGQPLCPKENRSYTELYLQKFRDSLSVPNRTGVTQNCIYRSFGTTSLSQREQELYSVDWKLQTFRDIPSALSPRVQQPINYLWNA